MLMLMRSWLNRLAFLGPLLCRVSVGLVFAQSGLGKLGNIERTTQFFASLGIPAPSFHAVFVGSIELVCGGLLVLGLLTRFSALLLIPVMGVALLTSALPEASDLIEALTLDETVYLAVLFWLALEGGGKLGLDSLLPGSFRISSSTLTTQHQGSTNMNQASFISAALLTLSAGLAQAETTEADPGMRDSIELGDKDGCKAKDGCKGKEGCGGKDGCGGKKKEAPTPKT